MVEKTVRLWLWGSETKDERLCIDFYHSWRFYEKVVHLDIPEGGNIVSAKVYIRTYTDQFNYTTLVMNGEIILDKDCGYQCTIEENIDVSLLIKPRPPASGIGTNTLRLGIHNALAPFAGSCYDFRGYLEAVCDVPEGTEPKLEEIEEEALELAPVPAETQGAGLMTILVLVLVVILLISAVRSSS